MLYHLSNLSYEAIGRNIGISGTTVKKMILSRAEWEAKFPVAVPDDEK